MLDTIEGIKDAVTQLTPKQLTDFRAWFIKFDVQQRVQSQDNWQQFATQNLARAYGDDEPDYTVVAKTKPV